MDFSSDANANFEGLLDVNQEICMPQIAEKTSPDAPPNCAAVPYAFPARFRSPVPMKPTCEKSSMSWRMR